MSLSSSDSFEKRYRGVEIGICSSSAQDITANCVVALCPIAQTVSGEPPEVHPFLGCSRLEEPLDRYGVTTAIHGHAHRGTAEGRTKSGIPVFNVAMGLMELASADHRPYRILELPVPRTGP